MNKGTITNYYSRGGGGIALSNTEYYDGHVLGLTFNWEAVPDVVYNQSTINWTLQAQVFPVGGTQYMKLGVASYYNRFGIALEANSSSVDGYTFDTPQKVYAGDPVELCSGSFTVTHNSSGNKTVTFYTSLPIGDAIKVVDGVEQTTVNFHDTCTATMSGTPVALDSISRHAIIYTDEEREVKDFTDEDTVAINYAVPSGTTGYIYLSLDGNASTETTALKAVTGAGTYNYSFSATDQAKLWTIQPLVTKRVRFFIKSVSPTDGTTYREPSNYVNLNIINYMPTLNTEVWDSNTDAVSRLTGDKYKLIRYVSNASYTTGGEAHKSATIQTQVTYNNGVSKHGASGTFEKIPGTDTSTEFEFSITDNYGRTTSETMQFNTTVGNYIPYVKLTCSVEVSEMTADGDVQVKITGKCFNGSFGKKTNRLRVFYDIVKNNEDDFNHVDLGYADYASNYGNSYYVSGNDYTYTLNISGLEYLSVYDFTVWVADEVATDGVSAFTVLASTPIFDWSRTDFNFNVPVTIQGGSVPTIMAQGTSGIWTYRTWSDGTAECWGKKDVSVTFPSSANWGSLYTTGAISASNVSFPYGLFAETPVVNASLLIRSVGGILMAPGGNDSNKATWDQTGIYEIARGAAVSGTQYYTINYQVIGKWK